MNLRTICTVALLGLLGACAQMQQGTGSNCPQGPQCPPLETVAVPPGSQVTVYTPTVVQPAVIKQRVSRRTIVQQPVATSTVPTRRVLATVTPIPPTVGKTVTTEIDVPLQVGKAPPGARRSSQATWLDQQFDCTKAGGVRRVNPSTGKSSCFIFDGPAQKQ